jgi:two-component sensor histidine kinase
MQAARKMQRNYFLFRHRRADGSIRDVEVYSGPIRVGGRELLYSIIYDITERRRAEEKIQNLLHEKELLLKEVHHRVINNMNTIHSLIRLQFEAQADPAVKMALQDAASRLQSMMVLYGKLYRSEIPNAVSMQGYFPPLLNEIVGIFPHAGTIEIKTRIDDIVLDPYLLSPLGIILTELTTNAMKHAFIGRSDGVITVTASKKENGVSITFEDNGIGLPDSISFENSSGFGMQLVGMLVEQIDGSITIERKQGTKYIIDFDVQ